MPLLIHQRIYDNGLGQYVIYAKYEIDTAPAAAETTPNYTGSLVTASHEVYDVQEVDPMGHVSDADTQGLWQFDGDLTADVGNALTLAAGTERYAPDANPDEEAIASDGGVHLNQARDANLAITGALTVQMLVRPRLVQSGYAVLVAFTGPISQAGNTLYQIRLASQNVLSYSHHHGNRQNDIWDNTGIILPVGEWSHVTFTRAANGVDIGFDINGINRASTTLANAPTDGTSSYLNVLDFSTGGFSPDCDLASLKINDTVMSTTNILEAARRTMPTYLVQQAV